jgi:hypothetical protein
LIPLQATTNAQEPDMKKILGLAVMGFAVFSADAATRLVGSYLSEVGSQQTTMVAASVALMITVVLRRRKKVSI